MRNRYGHHISHILSMCVRHTPHINPFHIGARQVCVCDASPEEMELVLRASGAFAVVSHRAEDARNLEIFKRHQAAMKAAETRRANAGHKRKLTELELEEWVRVEEQGQVDFEPDYV